MQSHYTVLQEGRKESVVVTADAIFQPPWNLWILGTRQAYKGFSLEGQVLQAYFSSLLNTPSFLAVDETVWIPQKQLEPMGTCPCSWVPLGYPGLSASLVSNFSAQAPFCHAFETLDLKG